MGRRLLVVSDNHGNTANLQFVLKECEGKFDALVHCGDSELGAQQVRSLVDCPVYMAEGNCDYDFEADSDDIFEFEGHVCFVTHGHRYGVNWGTGELVEKAKEMGADLVFYGHTHVPDYQNYEEDEVMIFNPGSVALPRQYPAEPTFLIVEFEEGGEVRPHFYSF